MKRLFLYALATMAIVFNTNGQIQQRVYLDSNWRITTKENATFYEEWQEDKKDGIIGSFKEYYISGKLKKEQNYVSEILNGISATYYENGQVESKGRYQQGQRIGVWQEWYENGQLRLEETYIIIDTKYGERGVKNGVLQEWYKNGKFKVKGLYNEGSAKGIWEEWHENGQLKSKGSYKEGKEEGLWEYFHENGQLANKGSYQVKEVEDKYNGSWNVAKQNGLWESWYLDGQKSVSLQYQLGDLVETAIVWHENGEKAAEYDFDKGVLVNGWDKDGIQLVEGGNGTMKHYGFNGKLISTGSYKNGLKSGEWTYHTWSGQVHSEIVKSELEELTEIERMSAGIRDEIFQIVEQSAQPTNGMQGFYRYVGREIKYPKASRKFGHQGKVFLSFVIDKDGAITFAKVVRGIGFSANREALRVIRNAPKWNPGRQRGRAVRQNMILPITFTLN